MTLNFWVPLQREILDIVAI